MRHYSIDDPHRDMRHPISEKAIGLSSDYTLTVYPSELRLLEPGSDEVAELFENLFFFDQIDTPHPPKCELSNSNIIP